MEVDRAVRVAESLLPGEGPITVENDPRWVALLAIRPHVAEEPEAVWEFVRRFGTCNEETLRHGVAVCLLQELLAQHFEAYLEKVDQLARESRTFADTFSRCAKYGRSADADNAGAFDRLMRFAHNFRR